MGEMLRWSGLSRYQIKVGSEMLRFESMHIGFLALRYRLKSLIVHGGHMVRKWQNQEMTGGWALS